MNLDKIRSQLRAILAKAADGSGATEEEAASALSFARRLMLRHQLTEADLGRENDRRSAHEIAADVEYGRAFACVDGAKFAQWQKTLSHAVAGLVGTVQTYQDSKLHQRRSSSGALAFDEQTGEVRHVRAFCFYGPAADCRDASELFEEWSVLVAALARMKFGGALRGPGRSYAEGFAMALYQKVEALRREERQLAQGAAPLIGATVGAELARREGEGSTCSALVVAGALEVMAAKQKLGASWLREQGVHLRTAGGGGGGRHHGDAYGAGKRDGANANFSRNRQGRLGR